MESADWRKYVTIAGAAAIGCGAGIAIGMHLSSSVRAINEGEEAAAAAKSSAGAGFKHRVAVFCGASKPVGPHAKDIMAAAEALGAAIPAEEMELVFGGGNIGLMGIIARAVDVSGGKVNGVIPKALAVRELSGKPVQEENEVIVDTMHERKMLMAAMSAGFIAMPGGYGTMEELFEAVSWTQLKIHTKPIGLLNVGGYYDSLVAQIDTAVEAGFVKPAMKDIFIVDPDPISLLRKIKAWTAPKDSQLNLSWGKKASQATRPAAGTAK